MACGADPADYTYPDLWTDPEHCGQCGQRCMASPGIRIACRDGACVDVCEAGAERCDGVCVRRIADRFGGCDAAQPCCPDLASGASVPGVPNWPNEPTGHRFHLQIRSRVTAELVATAGACPSPTDLRRRPILVESPTTRLRLHALDTDREVSPIAYAIRPPGAAPEVCLRLTADLAPGSYWLSHSFLPGEPDAAAVRLTTEPAPEPVGVGPGIRASGAYRVDELHAQVVTRVPLQLEAPSLVRLRLFSRMADYPPHDRCWTWLVLLDDRPGAAPLATSACGEIVHLLPAGRFTLELLHSAGGPTGDALLQVEIEPVAVRLAFPEGGPGTALPALAARGVHEFILNPGDRVSGLRLHGDDCGEVLVRGLEVEGVQQFISNGADRADPCWLQPAAPIAGPLRLWLNHRNHGALAPLRVEFLVP